jgi:hypothetical protein
MTATAGEKRAQRIVNADTYKTVMTKNAESLLNKVISRAEEAATTKIKHRDMTEDEVRNEAVRHFYAILAQHLSAHMQNNLAI